MVEVILHFIKKREKNRMFENASNKWVYGMPESTGVKLKVRSTDPTKVRHIFGVLLKTNHKNDKQMHTTIM